MAIPVVDAALRSRARRRYAELDSAMGELREALEQAEKVINAMKSVGDDSGGGWDGGGWSSRTPDELHSIRRRVCHEVSSLRARMKRLEGELLSREWRL